MADSLEQRLAVQYAVARILVDAPTIEAAAPRILQEIGANFNWVIGIFWRVDSAANCLRWTKSWHAQDARTTAFDQISQHRTFALGEGLPGRVWQAKAPVWLEDVTTTTNFPRLAIAAEAGLHTAAAFPVTLRQEIYGVMEFFSPAVEPFNEGLLQMMASIGSQIGQFIERQRVEHALRESEAQFRLVAETASDAIITISADSKILFVNAAATRIFGYAAAEMLGQDLTMLMPEYLRHLHHAGIERYVKTGQKHIPWQGVELPGLHQSGREIQVEVSFGEFRRGAEHLFTGIIREVTERKQAEQEREQSLAREKAANEQLRQLNESRLRMARTVSHELKNLLNNINMAVQFFERKDDPAMRQKMTGILRRNLRDMNGLLEQLLSYSVLLAGQEQVKPEPLELTPLCEELTLSFKPMAEAQGLRFEATCEPQFQLVTADRLKVKQIASNLLSNAIKYTPQGKVRFWLGGFDEQHWTITVEDTGVGIAPENLTLIFEEFHRIEATANVHGTGLGLAITKQLVETLGGRIEVSSEVGQGSRFAVILPKAMPSD